MNLYKYIYILSFNIIFAIPLEGVRNNELKIVRNSFKIDPNSVAIQLVSNVNNTSEIDDYSVEFRPDKCCLDIDDELDCNILEIIGDCSDIIPKGTSKTLTLVAPILNPFEFKGYCTAYLDSKPVNHQRGTMRDKVKIFLDTRIKDGDVFNNAKPCDDIDEDPFNNCEPVDCVKHYNGKRSYYYKVTKRCVAIPKCISKYKNHEASVYDPTNNVCVNNNPIMFEDVEYVRSLVHGKNRLTKDIVIIKKLRDPYITQNLVTVTVPSDDNNYESDDTNDLQIQNKNQKDSQTKKHSKEPSVKIVEAPKTKKKFMNRKNQTKVKNLEVINHGDAKPCLKFRVLAQMTNAVKIVSGCIMKKKYILMGLVMATQCCLIVGLMYFLSVNVFCRCKKRTERQYFNYRQDVSVTTPLIGTSNIETETTCQYLTESSNIDKRIQGYKSCLKEQNKTCLSDDILSKCLNRRKWEVKQSHSHNINPDYSTFVDNKGYNTNAVMQVSEYQQYSLCTNIPVMKNDNASDRSKPKKTASKSVKSVKKDSQVSVRKFADRKEFTDSEVVSSEQLIKCHSFNYMGPDRPKESGIDMQTNSVQTSIGLIKAPAAKSPKETTTRNKDFDTGFNQASIVYNTKVASRTHSHSTEKGAQASFSNDSIDDFLSERGMIYLAADDLSKSFSYSSGIRSSSPVSSKTSKKYTMKNVLSLFRRKSKKKVISEPGKSEEGSINLELIHMSRATVFSTSNTESVDLTAKKLKESRSSL